ncbi:signal transduction histidine kinase/CheY-like chemotaxis protein [Pararhizobium capsulatum DSM 1112]|uniref:histidine kinase n=1 Tax=Pararhizobium capsulatum DSM 1112 TaxID=1121113 RepID=A0ABU0BLC2_9HYPH|nr:ATP-binding protein [Pararhizobium capsulatum]MDQ0318713.1 signal transduction histidine kinase/CheY-like chemotaxis protein [Pararhizobium capsulatum DSM 1112]
MGELSNLHHRISRELVAQGHPFGDRYRTTASVEDDIEDLELETPETALPERYSVLKPALAGAGLLCSAAVLGTGADAGYELLSGGLALAGMAGAAVLLIDWYRSLKSTSPIAVNVPLSERVSDRKWERSEASGLLSTIHDALGDIALVREPAGKIVEANGVFRRVTGQSRPEGMTCEALGIEFEPMPEPHHYRVRIATVIGLRVFDWHDVMARQSGSGMLMMHSIARDITEESRVARESDDARRRAENASQAKSRLLATVSHEIRTPLSGILGVTHLISQTRLTGEQKNYLAGMRQSGHALVQLVDDLLDFSSIEAGRFQLRPSQEAVRHTIESVVEMLSSRAHEKGIEIGATISASVPGLLEFDAARLRQVLFNVIGNAVKFTHTGGVFVSADLVGSTLLVRVEDTGPGMNREEQARVFDEFEQAGDNLQRSGGSGLGLAISRRIIEQFGGSLTLSSEPGRGTTFDIRFPVNACERPASAHGRKGTLEGSRVLVMAPGGPASRALFETVTTLGGHCVRAETFGDAQIHAGWAASGQASLTDIIVDHRHAAQFRRLLADLPGLAQLNLRRIYLVNPEERNGRPMNQIDGYQAWLIRPLRERSLVEVLRGRMKGMEVRDAINDNRPMLREVPTLRIEPARQGVLLAEDDPVNALIIRSILEKAGHTVRPVGDFGALATVLFDAPASERMMPELIVTDLNMPGGTGLDMLERLRQEERTGYRRGSIPVIVLTSDTSDETRETLIAAGASAVLPKPVEPARLTAEIERLLR